MSKVVLERYTVPQADGTSKRMRYVARVEWRNIGLFWAWHIIGECGVRTPWGNLVLADWLPFEYRYGGKRAIAKFGKLYLRWVRLRTAEEDS